MKSKKLKLSIAKILTVVSIVGMMGVAIGPKLGLDVCQVHAEGPGDGTDDEKSGNCLTQEEAVKLVQDENNYSLDEQGNVMFTIPDNYGSIAPNAFNPEINTALAACSNWENVHIIVIGSNVKKMGKSAFKYCSMSEITLPQSLESLDDKCFYGCGKLEKVKLPKSVKSIGQFCFYNCSFKEINLPEGLETLGDGCFWYCFGLENISVPRSVNHIGIACFANCISLISIEFAEESALQELPACCCLYCESLQSIKIPPNVAVIGGDCFSCCHEIKSIEIPDRVEKIETFTPEKYKNSIVSKHEAEGCFSYCQKLEKINIPDNITELPPGCFQDDTSLKKVTIPSITIIPEKCFYGCKHLGPTVHIPGNVQIISHKAFAGCKKLKKIIFVDPDKIKSIGKGAFAGTALPEVEIPKNVKNISEGCFCGCRKLTKLTFTNPDKIESIEKGAFARTALQNVEIPQNVGNISEGCFCGCRKLTKLTFTNPDKIKSIKKEALAGTALKKFTIPGTVEWVHLNSFKNTETSLEALATKLKVDMSEYDDGSTEKAPLVISFPDATVISFYTEGDLGEQVTRFFVPAGTTVNIVPQK